MKFAIATAGFFTAMLFLAPADGDQFIKCADQPNLACAVTAGAVGVVPQNCSPNVVGAISSAGTITCVAGGGGGSTASQIAVSSCMTLTGAVSPLYMSPSTCLDPTETAVFERVSSNTTYQNLGCKLSAVLGGGQTLTMTLNKQTNCAGASSATSVNCVVSPSNDKCNTATTVAMNGGDCISVSAAASGTFTTPVQVNCQMERS
jgi:hypothetical protein